METLKYKKFTGSTHVSEEDSCLYGKIEDIDDLVLYEGKTLGELKESFKLAVDDYFKRKERYVKS